MSSLKNKKVALLTCFLDNYGACLQALALQSSIEKLGCDCNIIAYIEPWGYHHSDFLPSFKAHLRGELLVLLNILKKRQLPKEKIQHYKFKNFRNKYLKFEHINNSKNIKAYRTYNELDALTANYDAFVCGSDQIWNPTFYEKTTQHIFCALQKTKRVLHMPLA